MSLVEDGLLDLEREVTHYLPKSLGFDTDATVRDLLHHTSGLPDHHLALRATIEAEPGHLFTPAELLAAVPEERGAAGSPGSATDDVLLGLAIEHVTGLSVAQAFRAHVLTGTGLEGLVVQPEERPQGPVALPARPDAARRFEEGDGYLPSLAEASARWPAGGMASTTQALARFMQLLCGGHILSTAALSEFAAWADDPSGGVAGTGVLGLVNVDAGYAGMALCLPRTGRAVAIVSSAAEVASTVPVVPLMDSAVQP